MFFGRGIPPPDVFCLFFFDIDADAVDLDILVGADQDVLDAADDSRHNPR